MNNEKSLIFYKCRKTKTFKLYTHFLTKKTRQREIISVTLKIVNLIPGVEALNSGS